MERMRFCNSGTEANILALATALDATRRRKILVFREAYHGGVLVFSGAGSRINIPFEFVYADYNDAEGAASSIRKHAGDLAERYAGTRSDVIRLAVPGRHAATEAKDSAPPAPPPAYDSAAADAAWSDHGPADAFLGHLTGGGAPRAVCALATCCSCTRASSGRSMPCLASSKASAPRASSA